MVYDRGGYMIKVKSQQSKRIFSFLMLTLGAIIAAYALESFLIPNTILDGGITGCSIISKALQEALRKFSKCFPMLLRYLFL